MSRSTQPSNTKASTASTAMAEQTIIEKINAVTNVVEPGEKVECCICGSAYKNYGSLMTHIKTAHVELSKIEGCTYLTQYKKERCNKSGMIAEQPKQHDTPVSELEASHLRPVTMDPKSNKFGYVECTCGVSFHLSSMRQHYKRTVKHKSDEALQAAIKTWASAHDNMKLRSQTITQVEESAFLSGWRKLHGPVRAAAVQVLCSERQVADEARIADFMAGDVGENAAGPLAQEATTEEQCDPIKRVVQMVQAMQRQNEQLLRQNGTIMSELLQIKRGLGDSVDMVLPDLQLNNAFHEWEEPERWKHMKRHVFPFEST